MLRAALSMQVKFIVEFSIRVFYRSVYLGGNCSIRVYRSFLSKLVVKEAYCYNLLDFNKVNLQIS